MLQALSSIPFIVGSLLFWAFVVSAVLLDGKAEPTIQQIVRDTLDALRFYGFATVSFLLVKFLFSYPYSCCLLSIGWGIYYCNYNKHDNFSSVFVSATCPFEDDEECDPSDQHLPTTSKHLPSLPKLARNVHFSPTVSVRAYGLDVGDLHLILPTTFTRPMCHSGLPTCLTNTIIEEYTVPLLGDVGRRNPPAMSFDDKLRRLDVFAGHSRAELQGRIDDFWFHNHPSTIVPSSNDRLSDEEAMQFCERPAALCDPTEIPRLFVRRRPLTAATLSDAELYYQCQHTIEGTAYSQKEAHVQAIQDMAREHVAHHRRIVRVVTLTATKRPGSTSCPRTSRSLKRCGGCLEVPKKKSKRRMNMAATCWSVM